MRHNIERVEVFIACLFAERKSQTAAYCLHSQNITLCGIQRDNGEQIVDIPAFLQLIYVQNNLHRVSVAFYGEQKTDVFI